MGEQNSEWIKKTVRGIAEKRGNTGLTVLELGSFVGHSTTLWFTAFREALNKYFEIGSGPIMPNVVCVDMFDYAQIPPVGRANLAAKGFTDVDWSGDMLADFQKNTGFNAAGIQTIKSTIRDAFLLQLVPWMLYDVIFVDGNRSVESLTNYFGYIRPFTLPGRTIWCGPHYSSSYAPSVVEAVNNFKAKEICVLETNMDDSNMWCITFPEHYEC